MPLITSKLYITVETANNGANVVARTIEVPQPFFLSRFRTDLLLGVLRDAAEEFFKEFPMNNDITEHLALQHTEAENISKEANNVIQWWEVNVKNKERTKIEKDFNDNREDI